MHKAQNILEISLLAGLVVVVTVAVFTIYNNQKRDLVNMSNVVETGGICTGHNCGGGGVGGNGTGQN
ncbi:MAG: hypothetical protein WCY19_02485 [Candidatus Gastranaerophilaceae bacterium]